MTDDGSAQDEGDRFEQMAAGERILSYATARAKREALEIERARLAAEKKEQKEAERRKNQPKAEDLLPHDWHEARLEAEVIPPVKWLVADLIHPGLWFCSSPPKIGKSFLMTALCRAVATGTMVCNYRQAEKRAVLYLDLEGSKRRAKDRQRRVRGDWDHGSPDFHTFFEFPGMDRKGMELLEELIVLWGLGLIVIDIWADFRPMRGKGEDVYTYDIRSLKPVRALATKYDATIILVHHNRKAIDEDRMANLSGSSGTAGGVDGIIQIERARGANMAKLHFDPRDGDDQSLAVKFDAGLWTILGDADEFFANETRKAIHGLLSVRSAGLTASVIAEELELKAPAVRRMLRRMRDDNVVTSTPNNVWHVVNPAHYKA